MEEINETFEKHREKMAWLQMQLIKDVQWPLSKRIVKTDRKELSYF